MPVFGLSDSTQKELLKWALKQGEEEAHHKITRVAMYAALKDKFKTGEAGDVLSISRSSTLIEVLGIKAESIVEANYPQHNILNLEGFTDGQFAYCVSDQVFEHVEGSPFQAFRETVRVLKPGGWLCHTTCFINPIHAHPSDFWRFTPAALSLMANDAGCEDIEVGGWGNREAWALVEAGCRGVKIPAIRSHPLYKVATRNNERWPIVVWVTARKPG